MQHFEDYNGMGRLILKITQKHNWIRLGKKEIKMKKVPDTQINLNS